MNPLGVELQLQDADTEGLTGLEKAAALDHPVTSLGYMMLFTPYLPNCPVSQ